MKCARKKRVCNNNNNSLFCSFGLCFRTTAKQPVFGSKKKTKQKGEETTMRTHKKEEGRRETNVLSLIEEVACGLCGALDDVHGGVADAGLRHLALVALKVVRGRDGARAAEARQPRLLLGVVLLALAVVKEHVAADRLRVAKLLARVVRLARARARARTARCGLHRGARLGRGARGRAVQAHPRRVGVLRLLHPERHVVRKQRRLVVRVLGRGRLCPALLLLLLLLLGHVDHRPCARKGRWRGSRRGLGVRRVLDRVKVVEPRVRVERLGPELGRRVLRVADRRALFAPKNHRGLRCSRSSRCA